MARSQNGFGNWFNDFSKRKSTRIAIGVILLALSVVSEIQGVNPLHK